MSKILLLEDVDKYADTALQVLSGHSVDRVKTFADADVAVSKGGYDFHFFDIHVPYGSTQVRPIEEKFMDAFNQQPRALLEYIPTEDVLDLIMGQAPERAMPFGAILAQRLQKEGRNNYLIATSVFHNSTLANSLESSLKESGLNYHLGHDGSRNPKETREYWQEALNKSGLEAAR